MKQYITVRLEIDVLRRIERAARRLSNGGVPTSRAHAAEIALGAGLPAVEAAAASVQAKDEQ